MKFLSLFLILSLAVFVRCHELKGFTLKQFQFLYQIFTGDFMEMKKREKAEKSSVGNGTTTYLDYLTFIETRICFPYDVHESEKRDKRAKCIRAKGNGTMYLMNSYAEVMSLISPGPGSTRNDQQPGNCVVILFYTKFCPGCQALIPHYNSLSRNFPDIKVAALDAFDHPGLNTDFGIIGLPTIVLFHNGRMLLKFNNTQSATVTNFVNFITSNTNLKPNTTNVVVTSDDFSPTSPLKETMQEEKFDPYLWMSWMFIVACAVYYFTRSRTYGQIVEMINRTWRESNEAQMQ